MKYLTSLGELTEKKDSLTLGEAAHQRYSAYSGLKKLANAYTSKLCDC